jgi:hypothetical protein
MKVKNKIIYLITICTLITTEKSYAVSDNIWELIYQPRQRSVKSIASNKERLFIGTGNGILTSINEGKTFEDFGTENLQKDENGNSSVNWIDFNEEKNLIYIATSSGIYYSDIDNADWKLFFKNTINDSASVNSFTIDKNKMYISSNTGVWKCSLNENKETCNRINEGIKADPVSGNYIAHFLLNAKGDLILGTSTGVYSFDKKNKKWTDISGGIQELPDGRINVRHLLASNNNIYSACGSGIYLFDSENKKWINYSDGLSSNTEGFQETYYLDKIKGTIYVATSNGIYYLDNGKWINYSGGLRNYEGIKAAYWLKEHNGKLYSATNEGLFAISLNKEPESKITLKGRIETDYENLNKTEPDVIDVQSQALKFASLPTSDDYKRYRLQARIRNLIPRVGFDINSNNSVLDYYQFQKGITSNTSPANTFDANKTLRSQSDGVDVKQLSVLWNTNNLIYDDEIKEILNQARLTANIRENILDDVTRLYFQRRELQLESYISPVTDQKEKLKKELEIASITGQLDSRTGGWFSKEIERRKANGTKK